MPLFETIMPLPNPATVEDAFELIGGFSWFQLWAMAVLISPEIVAAMVALSPILTGSNDVLFLCDTNHHVVMSAKEIGVDSARFCTGQFSPMATSPSSVVEEWGLIGTKFWVSDLFTSVQMCGSMMGALLASQYAEKFGRKKAHFSLCFLLGGFGAASALAPDPYTFAVCRFFAGFGVGGCFVVYMNYLIEFLTPSYRTICGCVSLWAVGEMMLAGLAYLLPHWRHLTFATSVPVFLIFLAYPWFPESPRWLLCQEKTDEAFASFETIARWNGKTITLADVRGVQKNIITEPQSLSPFSSVFNSVKILRAREYRVQLGVCMTGWFTCQLVYYGISFNVKNLGGNVHWNVFSLGVLDLPGTFTGILLNNRMGRRAVYLLFISISATFLFALVGVEEGTSLTQTYPWLVNVLSLGSRYFISAAFAVLSCFTAESFPTVGRVGCVGLCALCGNVGGILSPQFAFLGTLATSAHFLAFGILVVLNAIVSLKLADRSGMPLEDGVVIATSPTRQSFLVSHTRGGCVSVVGEVSPGTSSEGPPNVS